MTATRTAAVGGAVLRRAMRVVLVIQGVALGWALADAAVAPGNRPMALGPEVAVLLCTAALCGCAAVRERKRSRPAPAWLLLTAAHLGVAGQIVAARPGALLGLVDLAPVLAVLTGAALWLLLRSALPPWRSGWWGDAAIVGLGGLALGAAGLCPVRPGTAPFPGPDTLLSTGAAVALAAAALAGVALTSTRPTWVARRIGAGLVLVSVSQTLYPSAAAGTQRGLLGLVWLSGYAVIGLATGPLDRTAPVTERRRTPSAARSGRPILSNVFLAISVALLALAVLRLPLLGVRVPQVAAGLALACVLAALIRPALAERRRRPGTRDLAPASPRSPRTGLTTLVPAQAERWVGDRRSAAALRRADQADGTDQLTGLANRKALSQALASDGAAARAAVEAGTAASGSVAAGPQPWSGWTDRIALLLVDLDRFKDINEALGHEAGDQVLAQVGTRLRAVLRPNQLLARLGGDEFAVVLPGAGPEPATRVAETLLAQLDEPLHVATDAGAQPVYVRASVGIATCRLPRGEPADLLRQADVAVYRAKESGGGIEHFNPERDQHGSDRLRRTNELRTALQQGDLEVFLQPQVDLAKGRVCGAEALARWRHPKDGVLLPAAFLPLAAQTGLMGPVSELVLERALTACSSWWSRGHRVPVSVNLSADDLLDPDLTGRIPTRISEHHLPPGALQIEITEDVLLTDPARVAQVLHGWRRLGIAVALDDYGTGYSSLAYLRELPIDELKLDRVFVADLDRPTTMTIVRHTVAMAHGLGMHVVAEGIEDRRTARALADAGCDVGQGLYFGAAMDPASFLTHLDMVTTS